MVAALACVILNAFQLKGKGKEEVTPLRILTGKVACNLLTPHKKSGLPVFSNIALSSDLVTTD